MYCPTCIKDVITTSEYIEDALTHTRTVVHRCSKCKTHIPKLAYPTDAKKESDTKACDVMEKKEVVKNTSTKNKPLKDKTKKSNGFSFM